MSAWQLVNAWNGFRADAVDETLTFAPKASGDLRLFWSSETAWGELERQGGRLRLTVRDGYANLRTVAGDGRTFVACPLSAGETLELV